jgi:hypothetical protein
MPTAMQWAFLLRLKKKKSHLVYFDLLKTENSPFLALKEVIENELHKNIKQQTTQLKDSSLI